MDEREAGRRPLAPDDPGEVGRGRRAELLDEQRSCRPDQHPDAFGRGRPVGRRQRLEHATQVDVGVSEVVVQPSRLIGVTRIHDDEAEVRRVVVGGAGGFDGGWRDVAPDHLREPPGEEPALPAIAAAEVEHW